jgi:undecaprenyl-diphosphatase
MKRLAAAFVPTAVVGLIVYRGVKSLLGDADVVAWSLLAGGVVILLFEEAYSGTCAFGGCGAWRRFSGWLGKAAFRITRGAPIDDPARMTYRQAVGLGLCQALAMIPGVSRSGATVIGGLALGLSRAAVVQFSFLLAVPTMLAATAYDLMKSATRFSGQDFGLLGIGFVAAYLVAWLVAKWFLRYVQGNDFRVFGVYRILAAVVYWLMIK